MTLDVAVGTRFSVLVVDDDPDQCFLVEQILGAEQIHVSTAHSGDEALQRLKGVDLVLLDYVLPGRSGLEVLREIRQSDGPSVVLVTAMGSESVVVEAMRAGAIDYLVKDSRYLQALPQVVERAWRTHDLARRSREVQRLALLVSSASGGVGVFEEIVAGARDLVRADECLLLLMEGDQLEVRARAGVAQIDPDEVRRRASITMSAPEPVGTTVGGHHLLLVPVRAADGTALGALALTRLGNSEVGAEESALAVTFAAFCGLALAHFKQLDLERSLVAELNETLEIRRELVAAVSHELRTPLTCILGFTATLNNHWFDLDDASRREFLTKVSEHGLELAGLVDGLLDFAAAEVGRLTAATIDLDVVAEAQSLVSQLDPLLAGRDVLVSQGSAWAKADPTLLRRTLSNLMSNAVKYSAATSPIHLTIASSGGWVTVAVRDEGVGLTPAEVQRVFEPFWRAGRGISRQRGTGIGLGLVRDYVRLMGGSVSVVSEPGRGSTFSFTLPAV